MLGGVAASVKIEIEGSGAFFEWLAQQIEAANNHWQGLRDPLTPASLTTAFVRIQFQAPKVANFGRDSITVALRGLEEK